MIVDIVKVGYDYRGRGWYICDSDGACYLNKNGDVKIGVSGDSFFWNTKVDAEIFLDEWKNKNGTM